MASNRTDDPASKTQTEGGNRAMDFFNSTAFDSWVTSLMSEWHVPGLSMTIIWNETMASKAFGYKTLNPPKKCTPDTLFDWASASKSTTAGALGLLVDDDERYPHVHWDTVVNDILPEFVMSKDEYTKAVTIEDILSHRSGLPSHDNSYFHKTDDPGSITRNLSNLAIAKPLRTEEQYCNLMYTVASYLVEKLSSRSFSDFLHERIWKPLGMCSTNLQPDGAKKAGLADRMSTPYLWKEEKQDYVALSYEQTPEAQGAGSIWSSTRDYALWVRALMNQEFPMTESMYKGLTKPRIFSNPDDSLDQLDPYHSWQAYCLGLEAYFYRGHLVYQHDGLISGYSSVIFFVPEFKIGGAFVGNSENAGSIGSGIILKEILDELVEVPRSERPEWNAIQAQAEQKYKNSQTEKAEELRKELSTKGDGEAESQKLPLSLYVGEYWNVGYRGLEVTTKDGRLFIDASDRTMGFMLSLDHFSSQTQFLATMFDVQTDGEEVDKLKVEFRFEGDGSVAKSMGVHLESGLDELIWFHRAEESKSSEVEEVILR